MPHNTQSPGFQPVRHDRLLQEAVHDPYRSKGKFPEPTLCPQCSAIFRQGRWEWLKDAPPPPAAHQETCPACQRIHDDFPAGYVTLKGHFFRNKRQEIMNLVRHTEERARSNHPLQRIMRTEEQDDGELITTTDIHLARAIGEAVHHAYQGKLEFHYNEEEDLLRVSWTH